MPEETPQPTRRRRTRKPPAAKGRRSRRSGSVSQIDKRISQAIRELTQAQADIARFAGAQVRHAHLTREINELIQLKNRLEGVSYLGASALPSPQVPEVPLLTPTPIPASTGSPAYSPSAPIPPGVGSIPAFPRQPQPTHGNVAVDIAGEGGFS